MRKIIIVNVLILCIVCLSLSSCQELKSTDPAVIKMEQAAALNKGNAKSHFDLGALYFEKKMYSHAFREMKEAVKLKPDYSEAHFKLATFYGEIKHDIKNGERECLESLRIKPSYDAYNYLGFLYAAAKDFDKAIAEYYKANKMQPTNTQAITNLGNAFCEKGEIDKGIAMFNKAIKLNPKDARPHNSLGSVYCVKLNDNVKAIAEYKEAIRLKPDFAMAHNSLGILYFNQGDYDNAIKEFETIISIDPKNRRARFYLDCARKGKELSVQR